MVIKTQSRVIRLIVHCTASPDISDIGVKEINDWHKARGFEAFDGITYCGYHYVIRRSGVIEAARPENIVGAHCQGFNAGSLGIAWVGTKFMEDAQKVALIKLVKDLMIKHGLYSTEKSLFGHCEFGSAIAQGKTCPNFDLGETFGSLLSFKKMVQTLLDLEDKNV